MAWITEGLGLGQRCLYLADAPPADLEAELCAVERCEEAVARGALAVRSLGEVYQGLVTPPRPNRQLSLALAAVAQAVADGYAGLRVAVDMTPLVAVEETRFAHLQWEQIVDRHMAVAPFAALCLYDAREITGIEAIAAAHALQGPETVGFAAYGGDTDEVRLHGEVDATLEAPFAEVLAALPASDRVVDLSGLDFVDGRAMWVLHRELLRRRESGQPMLIGGASDLFRRVWAALGFDGRFFSAD